MNSLLLGFGESTFARQNAIYIAGPMTGIEDGNKDAFYNADARLSRFFKTYNPVYNDNLKIAEDDWILYMHAGIWQLIQCNEIYMLQDWEKSKGARMEFNLACDLKMTISYEIDDPDYQPYEVKWLTI